MDLTASPPEWDEPVQEEELLAAEAAYRSSKRRLSPPPTPTSDGTPNGRRLPSWAASPAVGESYRDSLGSSSIPRIGGWRLAASPCRADVKMRYPSIRFGGRIVYSRTVSEVEEATLGLLEIIAARKRTVDHVPLGFDIEWRPSFVRGSIQRKAAVIQVCLGADLCHVMHIIHSGIPPILKSLLEDGTIVKVGASIGGDAAKMWRDYEVSVKDLEDLSHLANRKLGGVPKSWGLGSLVQTLACKRLDKPQRIRLGNWEAKELSRAQLEYAATDAYVSWYLYQVLRSFSDAEDIKVDD